MTPSSVIPTTMGDNVPGDNDFNLCGAAAILNDDLTKADDEVCAFVEDSENGQELVNLSQSYKSEPMKWQGQEWIIVKSIMDSGASAPVAPPSMAPNVPIWQVQGQKGDRFITQLRSRNWLTLVSSIYMQ